ncbi:hypothetical protein GCM10020219_078140 [Nonomuraea dietziae]
MAFAITGDSHGIDRVDLPASRTKRGDKQAAGCFDRNGNRGLWAVASLGKHGEQLVEAVDGLADALFGDQGAVLVDEGDVVVFLGPVDTAGDLQALPPVLALSLISALAEPHGALMERLYA